MPVRPVTPRDRDRDFAVLKERQHQEMMALIDRHVRERHLFLQDWDRMLDMELTRRFEALSLHK